MGDDKACELVTNCYKINWKKVGPYMENLLNYYVMRNEKTTRKGKRNE